MKKYLSNWGFMRTLRLASGIFIVVQGVLSQEWLFAFAGILFSVMAIFNIGCCGAAGCPAPVSKSSGKTEDITYEEVR